MSGHSPLPWIAKHLLHTGGYAILRETDHGARRVDTHKDGEFSEADARFLVQAVNAHAALVEACKGAMEHLKLEAKYGNRKKDRDRAQQLVDQLEAAIALAEESTP